jgi:hypothetical protein
VAYLQRLGKDIKGTALADAGVTGGPGR